MKNSAKVHQHQNGRFWEQKPKICRLFLPKLCLYQLNLVNFLHEASGFGEGDDDFLVVQNIIKC